MVSQCILGLKINILYFSEEITGSLIVQASVLLILLFLGRKSEMVEDHFELGLKCLE